jgi:hypothetical protein
MTWAKTFSFFAFVITFEREVINLRGAFVENVKEENHILCL